MTPADLVECDAALLAGVEPPTDADPEVAQERLLWLARSRGTALYEVIRTGAIEAAEAWCDDPSTPFKGAHRPAAQAYVAAYAAYVTAYAASAGHAAAAYVTAYAADATANAAYALGWPAIRPVMLAAAVREAHKDRTAPPREG